MPDISFKYNGRREDQRFITGLGQYTNDHNLPGQAYACFRRSDRAHAVIKSIDVEAAKSSPGVLAVLTGKDVADAGFGTLPPLQPPPGRGGQSLLWPERPILARDRVRFAGEEIAVVVAETQGQARDAADLIDVEFEDLPVVIGYRAGDGQGRRAAARSIFPAMSVSISNTATRKPRPMHSRAPPAPSP